MLALSKNSVMRLKGVESLHTVIVAKLKHVINGRIESDQAREEIENMKHLAMLRSAYPVRNPKP